MERRNVEYSSGRIGRVFAARFHDGENVYRGIEEIARREKLESAVVLAVGGARRGKVVEGPTDPNGPIRAMVSSFDDAREMLAVGTIFPDGDRPSLHLHAGIGRQGQTPIVGCPRQGLDAFLVLEVFLIEVNGLDAGRTLDPASGLKLLSFLHPARVAL